MKRLNMADLRDYKNKDFSITVNSRKKGIELRFENTMTEEQIEQIKEAGFRWSKRQQMWYAYQNEKTIAYAKSLESQYEANLENDESKQEVSLSEIQKSTKEKLAEQGASKELFDSHVVFATRNETKKEYADSYEW